MKRVALIAIRIYSRKIEINKPSLLNEPGPLLIAVNHPNSFLDAVILNTLFPPPVHSLARGDAFANKFITRILGALKILPVYRVSEGVENLANNYDTFEACKDIFRDGGHVMIFSEGRCINEWHLRPLKKGTARLAIDSWGHGIPVRILPVGINYSSFRRFGKNIILNFGNIIEQGDFDLDLPEGIRNLEFNRRLRMEMEQLVFEIDKDDKEKQERLLARRPSLSKKIFLFVPAIAGIITHTLIYFPVKLFTKHFTSHSDHYDSIIVALLLLSYPLYLLLVSLFLYFFTGNLLAFLVIPVFPLLAWSTVQLKPQLDH